MPRSSQRNAADALQAALDTTSIMPVRGHGPSREAVRRVAENPTAKEAQRMADDPHQPEKPLAIGEMVDVFAFDGEPVVDPEELGPVMPEDDPAAPPEPESSEPPTSEDVFSEFDWEQS